MQNLKQQVIFKLATLILVLALLTPSVVKAMHIFNDHHHEICYGENQKHLHKSDLDCEFYKFKISNPYVFTNLTYSILTLDNHQKKQTSQYQFISDYQKLQFSLRGPPQLV